LTVFGKSLDKEEKSVILTKLNRELKLKSRPKQRVAYHKVVQEITQSNSIQIISPVERTARIKIVDN